MTTADTLLKRLSDSERASQDANIRPRDAATLLLLDRADGGPWRVLMGRRHMRHRFYPGAFVFPGGRVDPEDSRTPVADDFAPEVLTKLQRDMKTARTATRARAFGVAAVRETYEEAGLFIAASAAPAPRTPAALHAFTERGLGVALSPLVFVARAITPPRRPRRFDTRFFAAKADAIAARTPDGIGPSGELEDVAWLTFEDAKAQPLPSITLTILDEVAHRLTAGADAWNPNAPVPYYYWRPSGFRRDLL
jgi:8-oxo-dGTP pyrophosphatase MutT (NUDIX family)